MKRRKVLRKVKDEGGVMKHVYRLIYENGQTSKQNSPQ